ncbi:metal-dependent hydrolase family protein [Arthrobacter sp. HMWF013]|uniref:metal-dependent hydrolase family protein n=1 Tax=Arthrobacter sp. HMWF013 TaxID=2056849 RepID=UPI000D352794|nr:amidohydrolase family protein [Arthrobacter sp. HMWF013]PTT70396.1 hypothetical protein DBR22_01260 [Arthrobacter sp. HMWF013]
MTVEQLHLQASSETEMPTILIAADRIITAPNQPVLHKGVVAVRAGRILAVGPAADFDQPHVALGNRTLTAGFIDSHVHLWKWPEGNGPLPHHQTREMQLMQVISNAQRFLRVGVTSVRDLGGPGNVVGVARDAIANGTVQGCRIQTANEVITITGGHGNSFGMECDDPVSLRRAVRQHVKQGSDWIKVMASGGFTNPYRSEKETPYSPLFSAEEMNLIVSEAHRFGLPVTAHSQGRDAIEIAFLAGVDTIEHASFAADPIAVVDLDLARAIGDKRVPVVPTTNNYWLSKGVPWAPLDIALANLKLLFDSGIPLAAGTDMGLPSTTPETYADGLVVMARAGIPLPEVLAAATTHAAAAIGDDQVGRIEPGLLADLVAMEGDPLVDADSYYKVTWAMLDGRIISTAGDQRFSSPSLPGKKWNGVHLFGD